ncbi:hypothetical protein XO12_00870 [Marinitoga sp. 1154]|uniref:GNAT family N-acetyltransferase n=1 Tax=Marinitoga sp. 1154 TaxID=1643335 RepID=UPI0015861E39|nr:GNAT family protein [Marinitoga sp. 1154]NUU98714.1 hypothetical protein [Marinitoga sp. 1154]
MFFKIKDKLEFIEILDSIIKIPKRDVYFFSEVESDFYYMNNIGTLYVLEIENEKSKEKTFKNFFPDNSLIYSILKLSKKSLIPFTIWDLVNFYKNGYKIRYLKEYNKILAFYILKNNVVDFVFFENENINLITQTLKDISYFVNNSYVINVYSNQKNFKNLLSNKNTIDIRNFYIYKLNSHGIYITNPQKNDSKKIINFYEKVFSNSTTLATQLNEFNKTVKDFEEIISLSKKLFGLRILVTKFTDKIIGNADIYWNIQRQRLKKTAKLGISVLESFRNMGIATTLINNHITWCIENPDIHRLELEVFSNNIKAISLYKKLGFIEEGRRKEAVYIDSKYFDIIMMGYITEPIFLF